MQPSASQLPTIITPKVTVDVGGSEQKWALGAAGVAFGLGVGYLAPLIVKKMMLPESKPIKEKSHREVYTNSQPAALRTYAVAGARMEKDLPLGTHELQLYASGNPEGQQVAILLEEFGVPYDAWKIDLGKGENYSTGFVAVSPLSKVPALVDRTAGSGITPLRVFESGNILLYLADKFMRMLPKDPKSRTECMNWVFMESASSMYISEFQLFFRNPGTAPEFCVHRYAGETRRVLDLLNKQLAGKLFLCANEYTIADVAWYPWIHSLIETPGAMDYLETKSFINLLSWADRMSARLAVKRGIVVNSQEVPERH